MKVQGNTIPNPILIFSYDQKPGTVEVRLSENVKKIDENLFEYDEYILHMEEREGLQEEIESNFAEWVATGRQLEMNANASEYVDATQERDALLDDIAQMVEEVYEMDLEMME